ncbi:TIR domain-containing protein [Sorangium sp. So ce448]|uniref:toll/interleukin-1 receptor domain-containing protein n=1 Tax=Sorangium sp. So ce448 TaxID=3133314 RepID=UPI003F5FFFC0
MPGPVEVFISYAEEDRALRRELEEHLAIMQRQGLIRAWHAEQVAPGQGFRTLIDSHISAAQLILLLVSPKFIASDNCYDREMAMALERWQRGEAQVIPVLVRPCEWDQTQLRRLRPLPDNGRPVVNWPSRDDAWLNVVQGIRRVVEQLPGALRGDPHVPPPWSPRASAPSSPAVAQPHSHHPAPSAPSAPELASWPPRVSASPHSTSARAMSGVPQTLPDSHPPSLGSRPASRSIPLRWPLALLALGALAAAAVALVRGADTDDLAELPLPAAGASSVVSLRALPEQPGAARAADVPSARGDVCPTPCCGGSQCAVDDQNTQKSVCLAGEPNCRACSSGRGCVAGSCGDMLSPARSLKLRLAHAVLGGQLLAPGARVCVRRSASIDPWTCMPHDDRADRPGADSSSGMSTRLPIAVADLMAGGGVDIWIDRGTTTQMPIAVHPRASYSEIGVFALCRGLRFDLKDPLNLSAQVGNVSFYLDDP